MKKDFWEKASAARAAVLADFCTRNVLPLNMRDGKHALECMGVVFGTLLDDLLVVANLPNGWRKAPTTEITCDLRDNLDRRRAVMLYNCQPHCRQAYLSVITRYSVVAMSSQIVDDHIVVQVFDRSEVVYTTAPVKNTIKAERAATRLAETWLAERYPLWRNAAAYWD